MEELPSIKNVLMKRDCLSSEEADEIINNLKDQIRQLIEEDNYLEIEEVLLSEVGLEPDYMDEILFELGY